MKATSFWRWFYFLLVGLVCAMSIGFHIEMKAMTREEAQKKLKDYKAKRKVLYALKDLTKNMEDVARNWNLKPTKSLSLEKRKRKSIVQEKREELRQCEPFLTADERSRLQQWDEEDRASHFECKTNFSNQSKAKDYASAPSFGSDKSAKENKQTSSFGDTTNENNYNKVRGNQRNNVNDDQRTQLLNRKEDLQRAHEETEKPYQRLTNKTESIFDNTEKNKKSAQSLRKKYRSLYRYIISAGIGLTGGMLLYWGYKNVKKPIKDGKRKRGIVQVVAGSLCIVTAAGIIYYT